MNRRTTLWLLSAAVLAGCGGTASPPVRPEFGPHQGRLVKLPDGLGVAEVVAEAVKKSPRSASYEVAAYFYGTDARTPLTPSPTDVAVRIYNAESKTLETVALKSADATAGKFAATPPPGFDGVVRSGRLSAKVGGTGVDLPF